MSWGAAGTGRTAVRLLCPVRGCGEPLGQEGARWFCARNHSFDQHRTGALNLLQPQDRRSKTPGDSREAAEARHLLAGLGHADAVHKALAHAISVRAEGGSTTVLDVGCGEGAFLRHLSAVPRLERHGLDISAPSIEMAAKSASEVLFVVANADRSLPYANQSFDFITSIDARVNALEFARVLRQGGLVLVAVPAPDDLVELRERVQGAKVEKSRAPRVEAEMAEGFAILDRTTVRENRTFDPPALRAIQIATYRGIRQSERAAVESLSTMTLTLAQDVLAFERR